VPQQPLLPVFLRPDKSDKIANPHRLHCTPFRSGRLANGTILKKPVMHPSMRQVTPVLRSLPLSPLHHQQPLSSCKKMHRCHCGSKCPEN
jgi:hypothetical protein